MVSSLEQHLSQAQRIKGGLLEENTCQVRTKEEVKEMMVRVHKAVSKKEGSGLDEGKENRSLDREGG